MLREDGFGFLPVSDVEEGQLHEFTCGTPTLDQFLVSTARPLHKARLGFTNVIFHEDEEGPIGFFTLASDAIPLETSERFELDLDESSETMSAIPALKIARLAVRQDLQGTGVGSFIMKLILSHALNGDKMSSSRLLVVDADNNERTIRFYEREGFVESLWAKNQRANHSRKGRPAATIKMHRDVLQP